MLDNIYLQNFKANRDVDVRIAPLTTLAGLNSSGKSTLLQAIGALRQSYTLDGQTEGLRLDGDLLQLGQYRDVLTENAATDPIVIEVKEDGENYRWVFRGAPSANDLPFDSKPTCLPKFIKSPNFQYLQANRIVPQTLYAQASHAARTTGFLGTRGEFTVGLLCPSNKHAVSETRTFPRSVSGVSTELLEKIAPTNSLPDQVSGWLQQISPGSRLAAEEVLGTDQVLLQFRYVGRLEDPGSNNYRPTNVGFGLTYSLPIIVSCLAAAPGALLLLENPEAHLHPRGQAAMGDLIARCVADGVQVIVETHSDHLLNGIRLAVKRNVVEASKIALHFFERAVETGDTFVQSPALLPTGRLSNWPIGFFDQWDKDIDALLE